MVNARPTFSFYVLFVVVVWWGCALIKEPKTEISYIESKLLWYVFKCEVFKRVFVGVGGKLKSLTLMLDKGVL